MRNIFLLIDVRVHLLLSFYEAHFLMEQRLMAF